MCKITRTVFSDLCSRGHDEDFLPAPALRSTRTLVGSPERVEVYRQRVAVGQSIWHPGDTKRRVGLTVWHKSEREILIYRVVVRGDLLDT